jgi:DNA polymerase-1
MVLSTLGTSSDDGEIVDACTVDKTGVLEDEAARIIREVREQMARGESIDSPENNARPKGTKAAKPKRKPKEKKFTCRECPLANRNNANPEYTANILELKRVHRRNKDQRLAMIIVGAPVSSTAIVTSEARTMITNWAKEHLKVDDLYITPVIKCVLDKDPTKTILKHCENQLRHEICLVQPNVIICMGKAAAAPFGLKGRAEELYNRVYDVRQFFDIDPATGNKTTQGSYPGCKLIVTYSVDKFVDDYKLRSSVEATFRQANRVITAGDAKPPDNYYLVESTEEFERWVDEHITSPQFNKLVHAFDIETNGREIHPKTKFDAQFAPILRCISFSWEKGCAICVPYENDPEGYYGPLKRFMESDVQFIGHNVTYDYFFLRIVNGIKTKRLVGDTMLMSALLVPGKGKYGYGLKPLAAELTDLGGYETDMKSLEDEVEEDPDNPKRKRVLVTKWERVQMNVMAPYNCADADATLQIYKILGARLKHQRMLVAHWIMTNALIPLGEMTHNGFLVDMKWVNESKVKLSKVLKEYEDELCRLAGKEYQWKSPADISMLLYQVFKYDVPSMDSWASDTKSEDTVVGANGESLPTGDDALSIINTPFTQCLRKWRKASKLLDSYFNGYLARLGLDGCLRADFDLHGTVTGRLSSSGDANLQNIPSGMAKTAPGYNELHEFKLKKAFIARPGWKIVNADQSQLELRIAGAVSGEEKFIKSYKNNIDMHSRNAWVSFGLNIDTSTWVAEAIAKGFPKGSEEHQVYVERAACKFIKNNYPDERQAAKSVSFGILYGMSKWGLAQDLNSKGRDAGSTKIWTPDECDQLIRKFQEGYPTLINWQQGLVKYAKKHGYTYTYFGRRRPLPLINTGTFSERSKSSRHALNTPVQSAGSDFMMTGVINMHQRLDHERFRFLATVHDSVVCEVREDYVPEFVAIAKDCLERPRINGKVVPMCEVMPFVAEFEIGDSYGSMEEYKG